MPHTNFINNYNTSTDLVSFLQKNINNLEYANYSERFSLIEQLSIEEQILLINLMYIGRGDSDEDDFYKEHFYKGYKYSYDQWKNDSYLIQQMLGKAQFIDYLKDAINKYKTGFKLK